MVNIYDITTYATIIALQICCVTFVGTRGMREIVPNIVFDDIIGWATLLEDTYKILCI